MVLVAMEIALADSNESVFESWCIGFLLARKSSEFLGPFLGSLDFALANFSKRIYAVQTY
jgi:hypothetical protein